jgi:hypothetical protein
MVDSIADGLGIYKHPQRGWRPVLTRSSRLIAGPASGKRLSARKHARCSAKVTLTVQCEVRDARNAAAARIHGHSITDW